MLDRLKTALVESYVGAIALGFLFAEGIQRVAYIFADPATRWMLERFQQHQNNRYPGIFNEPPRFPFELAIPQLFTALFLLAVAIAMLRWLYFPEADKQHEAAEPEEDA